jgi:hypothetical protein
MCSDLILCSACRTPKPQSEFYRKASRTGTCRLCVVKRNKVWASKNKVRKSETDRRWRRENKARSIATNKNWVFKNKARRSVIHKKSKTKTGPARNALIDAAKSRPCWDCGKSFPTVAMDLDHIPGTHKRYAVSVFRKIGFSLNSVKEELAKCQLVCANCHRLRTESRRTETATPSPALIRYRSIREWVNSTFKNKPCAVCAEVFKPCQMDFDHIDPLQKVANVSSLVQSRMGRDTIAAEIAKCRLVCVNCHRLSPLGP